MCLLRKNGYPQQAVENSLWNSPRAAKAGVINSIFQQAFDNSNGKKHNLYVTIVNKYPLFVPKTEK